MKIRFELKKPRFCKQLRLHHRTLLASSFIAELLCSFGTFVGLCKKQKGAARVFAFFGGIFALFGLALLSAHESEQKRGKALCDEDSFDEDSFDGQKNAEQPSFASAVQFPAAKDTVRALFTDEKAPFAETKSETKKDGKTDKNTGTNDTVPPSKGNVAVLVPDVSEITSEQGEKERLEKERIELEKERIALEKKREEENRKARERLDEAIRILKNAAESLPENDSETDVERELSVSSESAESPFSEKM